MKTEQFNYNRLELKNLDTGKVIGNTLLKTDGSEEVILDIKNKNKRNGYKKKLKQIEDIKEHIEANEGNYIHNLYKYCYPYLLELQALDEGNKNNIHIIRFVVLATYLSKDGYVRFESRKIKKSSLQKIWDIKCRKEAKKTYDKLLKCSYIFEDKEGYLMINRDVFVNGKIEGFKNLQNKDSNLTYTRLFTKNIQDLYYNTDIKKRKLLANLFKILPFVSFKHNIFCTNPTELDEKKLNFLTWTDLARICGYEDKKHIAKFKKDMLNLEIYKDVSTLGVFLGANAKQCICVNPKVYYSGNNREEVRHLYAMFNLIDNNIPNNKSKLI